VSNWLKIDLILEWRPPRLVVRGKVFG